MHSAGETTRNMATWQQWQENKRELLCRVCSFEIYPNDREKNSFYLAAIAPVLAGVGSNGEQFLTFLYVNVRSGLEKAGDLKYVCRHKRMTLLLVYPLYKF